MELDFGSGIEKELHLWNKVLEVELKEDSIYGTRFWKWNSRQNKNTWVIFILMEEYRAMFQVVLLTHGKAKLTMSTSQSIIHTRRMTQSGEYRMAVSADHCCIP
jgi:hypothetical protein